jgi:PAS domain-containing protein
MAEEPLLRANPIKKAAEASDESNLAALTKLATISSEFLVSDLRARIATLEAQALRHETAIDKIS